MWILDYMLPFIINVFIHSGIISTLDLPTISIAHLLATDNQRFIFVPTHPLTVWIFAAAISPPLPTFLKSRSTWGIRYWERPSVPAMRQRNLIILSKTASNLAELSGCWLVFYLHEKSKLLKK